MKKILSLVLSFVMLLALLIPASAITAPKARIKYPCIYIHGNAGSIVDADENQVYDFDVSTDQILDICKKVLPKLGKGLITGKLDDYYDSFEEEFRLLYDKCSLDKNGDPKYGTRESKTNRNITANCRHKNLYKNGGFGMEDYVFYMDWRLDPLYNADLLDVFINDIMKATGKDKVCLCSDCLGSVNILGYLGKYGHDKIYGIGMVDPVGFGCELVEDLFSGHLDLDPDLIEQFAKDRFIQNVIPEDYATIFEFVKTTLELANDTGVLDGFSEAFVKLLYNRLKDELVPRLALASYGSWLSYWGLVSADRYEETKKLMFGQPGSKRYDEYSVFIEKLDAYDTLVRQRIPEILTSAKEDGVKIAIAAKYGVRLPCMLEGADRQGDVWVSLQYATIGATCAPVGETLSDEYIAEREALGLGKYISPDRIVDMSTCLFPDNTWIIKNRIHNEGSLENQIVGYALANDNVTVDNSFAPQFLVHLTETDTCEAMTPENCHTESWYTEPTESKGFLSDTFAKIKNFFATVKLWFSQLSGLLSMLFG